MQKTYNGRFVSWHFLPVGTWVLHLTTMRATLKR